MTAREKNLAMAVGGVVAFILNYSLVEFFFKTQTQLRLELVKKQEQIKRDQPVIAEQSLWESRSRWLADHQIKLIKERGADTDLLTKVQAVAAKNGVVLENPVLGNGLDKRPHRTAVFITFETKSDWAALCAFMRELQGVEEFIVFEKVGLKVNSVEKTQMQGNFQVSKWFAPN